MFEREGVELETRVLGLARTAKYPHRLLGLEPDSELAEGLEARSCSTEARLALAQTLGEE